MLWQPVRWLLTSEARCGRPDSVCHYGIAANGTIFAAVRHQTADGRPLTRNDLANSTKTRRSELGRESDEVMVVGPGARFLSGVGYHTAAIANAFARRGDSVDAIMILDLLPRRLYPGRDRVGKHGSEVLHLAKIPICEGLDWYWGMSFISIICAFWRRRPKVVLLQWWTAVTAHSYLALALAARLTGARVVIEMHESHDVGEAALPFVSRYARLMMRVLPRRSGVVVHWSLISMWCRDAIRREQTPLRRGISGAPEGTPSAVGVVSAGRLRREGRSGEIPFLRSYSRIQGHR